MSRVFVDDDLLPWEAYASRGRFGLPEHPKIVFHCLSDPAVRARFVIHSGDEADAEEVVHEVPEERLKAMLKDSQELE
ncbi:MAG TPA: hypothetical protein VGV85_10425 [Longimicrobiaceae bacterium]|nr:hypothetical protein [Longimicrobiaceae bacterium]